jgi:ankyrin repeat protein
MLYSKFKSIRLSLLFILIIYLTSLNNCSLFIIFFQKAARSNNVDIVELLLRKGFDVNIKDDDGNTPLHHGN